VLPVGNNRESALRACRSKVAGGLNELLEERCQVEVADVAVVFRVATVKRCCCEDKRRPGAERPSSAAAATAVTPSPGKSITVAAVRYCALFGDSLT
jgi:hypothetical protein